MTSPKVTTTFVASEVKLYLTPAPLSSSPPLSPGPIASLSLGRRRARSGPAAGPPQGTIPVHKRAPRLGRERPQVDRSAEQLTVYPPAVSRTG